MIKITTVEVTTNGGGHLIDSYETDHVLDNKGQFEEFKKAIKENYKKDFPNNDLEVYLSYVEMV